MGYLFYSILYHEIERSCMAFKDKTIKIASVLLTYNSALITLLFNIKTFL